MVFGGLQTIKLKGLGDRGSWQAIEITSLYNDQIRTHYI